MAAQEDARSERTKRARARSQELTAIESAHVSRRTQSRLTWNVSSRCTRSPVNVNTSANTMWVSTTFFRADMRVPMRPRASYPDRCRL
jgi:hypothetical protein